MVIVCDDIIWYHRCGYSSYSDHLLLLLSHNSNDFDHDRQQNRSGNPENPSSAMISQDFSPPHGQSHLRPKLPHWPARRLQSRRLVDSVPRLLGRLGDASWQKKATHLAPWRWKPMTMWGCPKTSWGYPHSWMVFVGENHILKIGGWLGVAPMPKRKSPYGWWSPRYKGTLTILNPYFNFVVPMVVDPSHLINPNRHGKGIGPLHVRFSLVGACACVMIPYVLM